MMYYSQGFKFGDYTPTLGDLATSNYPLFNDWWNTYIPEHKKTLETKILHTYFFNQIGQDTPDRFAWMLNATLERIMPYYNKLYESELIKIDPILNHFIESNNRSIENMIREANTGTSKASKAIKDFVNNGNSRGSTTTEFGGNYSRVLDRDVNSEYNKDGTEDKIKDTTSNETQVTDNDTTRDLSRTDDNTKVTTGNVTENTERHTTSNNSEDESTDTSRHETVMYSDTPQRDLTTQGILTNYLTNYTQTDSTENTDRHLTGNASEDMNQTVTTNSTENQTEDNKRTENETGTSDTTRTTDFTEKETQDNEWTEEGTSHEETDETETSNTSEDSNVNTQGYTFNKQREDSATSEATDKQENEKQTNDTGTDSITKGFMNVSASQLLSQFRDTFLNIDNMIIDELRPLFMEVF